MKSLHILDHTGTICRRD